jgi:hypothetical protein
VNKYEIGQRNKQSSKSNIAALIRGTATENKTTSINCKLQHESAEQINVTFLTKYK